MKGVVIEMTALLVGGVTAWYLLPVLFWLMPYIIGATTGFAIVLVLCFIFKLPDPTRLFWRIQ